jgi:predicted LPLAT superfamily acyltransferase
VAEVENWEDRNLGRDWGWGFFYQLIRLGGRWPAYAGMLVLASFYWAFAGSHRRGVQAYLDRIGGGSSWRVFYNFACSIVDRFLMLSHGVEVFDYVHEETEAAAACLAQQGGLVMAAHVGNPDLGAAVLRTDDYAARPVNILAYAGNDDPYIRLMKRHVGDSAPRLISLKQNADMAAMEALRALRRKEIVALKADRLVDERTCEVDFLGDTIQLPTGPFLLAALSKSPVVFMGCFKEGGDYRVLATEPRVLKFTSRKTRDADLQRWAQDYANQLAAWLQRYPEQYYNFHDVWA